MTTSFGSKNRNILIVSLQGIGNTALLLPVIHKLANQNVQALDIVVSNNGSAQLLLNNPGIRHVYVWDEKESGLKNVYRLWKEFRGIKYDVTYAAFPNWTRENTVALIAASRKRIGYSGDTKYFSDRILCWFGGLTRPRPIKQHDVLSNLDLFGLGTEPIDLAAKLFHYTKQEMDLNAKLAKKDLSDEDTLIVGLHPGSSALEKRWGKDKFSALAIAIAQKHTQVKFLIFGSSVEKEELSAVYRALRGHASLLDNLSIRQAAWFISKCDLFVGNDSAPVHLAALQGVPAIAITGPADYIRTSPIGKKNIVIRKDLLCSPCYGLARNISKECLYKLKCIRDISSAEVFEIVDRCLKEIIADKYGFDSTKDQVNPCAMTRKELFSSAIVLNLK